MNFKLIPPLLLLSTIIASFCNSPKKTAFSNDPYGIIETEETGEVTDRLVACSQNEGCPEFANALFWVAADLLSEAGAKSAEVEGRDFGLTDDMTIDEMAEKIGPQLEALIDDRPPEYDFDSLEFQEGHEMMKKAHVAGSIYAPNELGLLHMEHSPIRDFDLARTYFDTSLEMGDAYGAYNLARLARLETPPDDRKVITYLEKASSGKNPDLKITYMLALEAFGTESEKQMATRFLKKNKVGKYGIRNEFEEQFYLKETAE